MKTQLKEYEEELSMLRARAEVLSKLLANERAKCLKDEDISSVMEYFKELEIAKANYSNKIEELHESDQTYKDTINKFHVAAQNVAKIHNIDKYDVINYVENLNISINNTLNACKNVFK